jgi:drug/metabolite transporter (DMT)-like permease
MAASALVLLAFALVTRSIVQQSRVLRARQGWRACFLPALFGSFIAMATMQFSLTRLKAGVASVLLAMTPIFTIPVAWRMLNHRPSLRAVGGAIIAIAGAWLLANPSPAST